MRGPRRNLAYRSAGHSCDGLGLFLVGQVGKHGRHAGDFAHAPHGLATGIAQVVHDDDLVVTLEQFHHGVAADEPGTPVTSTQVSAGSFASRAFAMGAFFLGNDDAGFALLNRMTLWYQVGMACRYI